MLALLVAGERAQTANDIGGTCGLHGDLSQRLAQIREVAPGTGEQPLAGLGIVRDGSERLIELVRNPRRHLTNRGHARHIQQTAMQRRGRFVHA